MFCYNFFTEFTGSVLPAKERRRRQLYNCRRQLDTVTGEQNVLERKGVELEQKIRDQEEGIDRQTDRHMYQLCTVSVQSL